MDVINRNIKLLREDLEYIKEHMVDIDSLLSIEDRQALEEARAEFRENKAVTLEEFEKQLNL